MMQEDYETKIDEPIHLKHSLLGKENHPCTMLFSFMTTIKAIWPWLHSSWRRSLALLEKPLIVPICTGEEDGFMHGCSIIEAGDRGNNLKMFGRYDFTV